MAELRAGEVSLAEVEPAAREVLARAHTELNALPRPLFEQALSHDFDRPQPECLPKIRRSWPVFARRVCWRRGRAPHRNRGELRCRVGDLRARPQPMGPGAWGRWIRWWSVAGLSTSSGGSVTRLRLPVRTRLHVGLIFGFEGEPVPIVGSVGRRVLIGEVEAGLVLEPVHAGSGEGRR